MVDHTPIVPPDLASVLATLAQFAPNQTQLQHAQSNTTSANWQQSSLSSGKGAAAVLNVPQTRTPQPEKQVIDPATITEWSAGLRCVTKIAAQNRHFAESIRRMINDQRKHEMQWYANRQALKKEQAMRGTQAGKLRDIMKSVGALTSNEQQKAQTAEELQGELFVYDKKIHAAQSEMTRSMTLELKQLGVPFFGTQTNLVTKEAFSAHEDGPIVQRPKWSPTISSTEHADLQRRMLQYLEDMYKD